MSAYEEFKVGFQKSYRSTNDWYRLVHNALHKQASNTTMRLQASLAMKVLAPCCEVTAAVRAVLVEPGSLSKR